MGQNFAPVTRSALAERRQDVVALPAAAGRILALQVWRSKAGTATAPHMTRSKKMQTLRLVAFARSSLHRRVLLQVVLVVIDSGPDQFL